MTSVRSWLRRAATAATVRPLIKVSVPPWWAQVLVFGGATRAQVRIEDDGSPPAIAARNPAIRPPLRPPNATAEGLKLCSATERLSIRNHPVFSALDLAFQFGSYRTQAQEVRYLTRKAFVNDRKRNIEDVDRSYRQVNDLFRMLLRIEFVTLRRLFGRKSEPTDELVNILIEALNISQDLVRDPDFYRVSSKIYARVVRLSNLIEDAGKLVNELTEEFARLLAERDPAFLRRIDSTRAPAIAEAVLHDLACDLPRCDPAIAGEGVFMRNLALARNRIHTLDRVRRDFVGADVHAASLDGIPLDGVRWSSTTRWPPAWEESIRRDSVKIGLDLFEIRPGTAAVSDNAPLAFV
jgi:hypothetical protein